jgi:hypothetical protein
MGKGGEADSPQSVHRKCRKNGGGFRDSHLCAGYSGFYPMSTTCTRSGRISSRAGEKEILEREKARGISDSKDLERTARFLQ